MKRESPSDGNGFYVRRRRCIGNPKATHTPSVTIHKAFVMPAQSSDSRLLRSMWHEAPTTIWPPENTAGG